MSLLAGRKAYESLKETTQYTVVLRGYTEVEATEPTDRVLGFISFKFELLDDGRTITDTRSVPQGTDILARQLLERLQSYSPKNKFNGIDQEQFFKMCMEKEIKFPMWITHRTVEDNTYTNYTFQEPIKATAPTTSQARTEKGFE